jgi:hypothetical protein
MAATVSCKTRSERKVRLCLRRKQIARFEATEVHFLKDKTIRNSRERNSVWTEFCEVMVFDNDCMMKL